MRGPPLDLDRMIPILYADFHNAHSLRKSRFAYLLDSGTKKVQAGFACSFREYTCSEGGERLHLEHLLGRRIPRAY